MKKTVSLILCLCMLASVAVVFSSCSSSDVQVDLSAYSVVYSKDLDNIFKDQAKRFTELLNDAAGTSLKSSTDKSSAGQYEILIGETNRPESAEVMSSIKGDGYAICMKNDKLVIVGTSNVLTVKALGVFVDTYLSDSNVDPATFTLPAKTVVSEVAMIEIDKKFSIQYSEELDDDKGNLYNKDSVLSFNPNAYSYPVVAAYNLAEGLAKQLSLEASDMDVTSDKYVNVEKLISVGKTTNELSATLAKKLDAKTYGFMVNGNNIAVTGTNDDGIRAAVILFNDVIEFCQADGVVRLPADMYWISARNTDWITDFPRPEGEDIELTGTLDVADNSVEFCYTGSGVSADAYKAYCETLKSAGYTVHMENTIGQSIFTTFVNEKAHATLHVTYAAYEYASAQKVTLYEPCIRIVSSELDSVNLVDEEALNPKQTYDKVTDSRITSMNLDETYGNSYVITLEDGSFIVYDGGFGTSTEPLRLYYLLQDLHYQAHGTLPSVSKPITVAAWMLSHSHGDHHGNFLKVCKTYGSQIVVERLLFNASSDEENFNANNPNSSIRDDMNSIEKLTKGGMKYIKVHSGQVLYLRNVEVEILYTHEDIFPVRSDFFNDYSTVFRTNIYCTDGNGNRLNEGTSVMWLGDAYDRASKNMRAMYGSYLKSDMVQVAHHGWNGCEWDLYKLIAPTCVWWPVQMSTFISQVSGSSSSYAYQTDYKIANTLSSVQYIIVGDVYNTTVTITKDGPDFRLQSESETGLYNAGKTASGVLENVTNPITQYGGVLIRKSK